MKQIDYERLSAGKDILESDRFAQAEKVIHHRKTSVAQHSRQTAVYGSKISAMLRRHNIEVNEEDVVRACLLHDIGMTEQEIHDSVSWKKAYRHPRKGEEIAKEEFGANEKQCDAIRKHMWPICATTPSSVEGWVVVAADKCCSVNELIRLSVPTAAVSLLIRRIIKDRGAKD